MNRQCAWMKEDLMALDSHGLGLVPMSKFYSRDDTDHNFAYTESIDYLRDVGAIEEFPDRQPHVRITNYLLSSSNCFAARPYFSVCCINECEALMSELERRVQAPEAQVGELIALIGNLSTSTIDAPRSLPSSLVERLHAIAAKSNGQVPLHGRLFAQWLHFAFPNECPVPLSGSDGILTPTEINRKALVVSAEELQKHINQTSGVVTGMPGEGESASLSQWSDDEVLPLHEAPKHSRNVLHGIL